MTDSQTLKTGTFTVTDVEQVGTADDRGVVAYNVHLKGIEQSLFMRAKRAPEVGREETGEIKKETSKAGKPYYRFYREQKSFGGGHGGGVQTQLVLDKLDAIHSDVKKLLGTDEAPANTSSPKLDEVYPVNEEEPISLSDIPF